LTGTVLKLNNEIDSIDYNDIKKVIKPADKKTDETPIEFQFKWDNIPNVSFDDVAGLEEVKNTVFKKVILPLNNPELYDGYDKQNGGGLLLYGPPGTGKTMIAAALAHEIGAKFCSVRASDLVLSGIGNSEQAISKLFSEARSFKCAVIFFDEIDAICPAETRAQHAKQIRSELLSQMQGLDSYLSNSENILFLVAATNKPWAIDTAFLRPGRFGIRTYVGLPSSEAKLAIIKNKLSKIEEHGVVKISENLDLDEIVTRTVDFNGADVANLMDEVQENSIMRSIKSGDKVILPEDFDLAFEKIKSSVIKEDLVKFSHWEENI
jgi:transitional endoplasmic reticulum ATPase